MSVHRTLEEDATNPAALTLRLQLYYYRSVILPGSLIEYAYPKEVRRRRVKNSGDISSHKVRVFISEVFRFEDLGFEMKREDFYRVFFRERQIREFDVEAPRFRAAQVFAMNVGVANELGEGPTLRALQ